MFEAGEEASCIEEGEIGRIPERRKGGYSHVGRLVLSFVYCGVKELRSIQEASSMSLLSQWITGLDLQSSK